MIEYIEQRQGESLVKVPKLDALKNILTPFLEQLQAEKEENDALKKPKKIPFNARIYQKLESVLLRFELPITNADALELFTADALYSAYADYCDLCCFIEDFLNIAYNKNKPEFCAFCAITVDAFEKIKREGDYHQREAASDIDNRIANSIQVATECNEIRAGSARFRLTAKSGIGHRIATTGTTEQIINIPMGANAFTPLDELLPAELPKLLD